jgi:hypothetical protein
MMIRKHKIHLRVLPSQQRFLECQAQKKGFSGPVGSGKTVALCYQAAMSAVRNPNCDGLIGGPTYPMLRDVTVKAMLQILDEKDIPYSYLKQEMELTLRRSQSRILFRSVDHYESLRGPNLAWVGIDELTYCRPEAWQRLEARVRDPRAKQHQMFAVWTPKGFDWVYRRFISIADKMPGHEAILALPNENVAMLAARPDFYEQLRASYDDRFYRQEALGEYLNVFTGRVYHPYSDANQVADLRFAPEIGLCWTLDFNVDPMTAIIAQCIHGKIHVLEEIFLSNSNTSAMCERFEQRANFYLQKYRAANGGAPLPVTVYGDAAGQARSTSSKTDYDLIREYFRGRGQFRLQFDYPRSNPRVKDRVNSVNAMLRNADGSIHTYVHPGCKELIADFYEVAWKQSSVNFELDKVTDKRRTHLSDALGYLVWQVAPISAFHREIITP